MHLFGELSGGAGRGVEAIFQDPVAAVPAGRHPQDQVDGLGRGFVRSGQRLLLMDGGEMTRTSSVYLGNLSLL
jgi:hypothetical protein